MDHPFGVLTLYKILSTIIVLSWLFLEIYNYICYVIYIFVVFLPTLLYINKYIS